jgi:serine/threonine protein kinase/tetratricopeptide (TPR) repeat protein
VREAAESSRLIRFESFEVNLRSGELRRDGERIRLPEQSFQILAMLLERPGQLVMRHEIQKRLWPNDTVVEFENSINAAVKRLRMALEDSADEPHYVETLARRGYRWMVPVEWVDTNADSSQDAVLAAGSRQAESTAPNLIGKRVSHYRVLEVLGGGGMGVIYKAEDIKLGRRVALKFLPEELSTDPAAMQRLEREARAASTLNHPNICTIYEVEEHDGQPFIVMELLEGRTLRDLISSGERRHSPGREVTTPLALQTVIDLGAQIAKGLEAAHQKGIVHRDIKPANIFVSNQGQAKILDFGLARLGESIASQSPDEAKTTRAAFTNPALTRTGATIGTAGYMSPEQVRGEDLDPRTDLFSFGLVLYEMAGGQRAFPAKTEEMLHDAVLHGVPKPVRELNRQLPPALEAVISKALEKDRNLRYQSATEMRADLQRVQRDVLESAPGLPKYSKFWGSDWKHRRSTALLVTALVLLAAAIWGWRSVASVSAARITDKDTVVLADFANSTGDPIFDETLRPALLSSLQQSPFLNILSERRVALALKMMVKPADSRLTPDLARDVCRRQQSKAYINGAIAALGNEYVIGLKAVNCVSGTTLVEEQGTAENKGAVLKVVGNAASNLRAHMGESLASVAKYDVPFDQTTSSLEALREYELGMKVGDHDMAGQIPHFLRAIQLDPDFAMAYLSTGESYTNLNQPARASEYLTKAFQLRDHADARERLEIESLYFGYVTGELDKAAQSYRKTIESYPKSSPSPYGNLSYVYSQQGEYEKALELAREVLRRYPAFGGEAYEGIAENLLPLQRFDEARQILQAAIDRKADIDGVHKDFYILGFVTGDSRAMDDQAKWLENKPEYANLGFSLEADTVAYRGELRKARVLTERAVDAAVRSDNKEAGAIWRNNGALREALFGNRALASQYAKAAIKMAPSSQHVQIRAALALAMAHESLRARTLAQALAKRYPLDTQVQSMWLPTINAQLALVEDKPAVALDLLSGVTQTELGAVPFNTSVSCLFPVYVRAEANLQLGRADAAASDFQKILDHRGIVWNCPTGALARLGVARANALQAQFEKGVAADAALTRARNAYEEFLQVWQDADPEVPILKQAKTEYGKLRP